MPDGYRLLWAGWYRLEDGAGPYAWDGGAGFELIGSGRGASPGGGELLEGEDNGFATDFLHPVDAERVAVKTAGTVVASTVDGFYQNAGTSPKMVYDVAGVLGWSPHNMLLQSSSLDAAVWNKGAGTLATNAISAPNGAMEADGYILPIPGGSNVFQGVTTVSGTTYTLSVYLKNGPLGNNWFHFATVAGSVYRAWFNLATGAKGSSAGSPTSYNIVSVGNGWYRCDVTFVAGATSCTCYLITDTGDGAIGVVPGDGTSPSFYSWGAQLNHGTVPTAYLPTTTAVRFGLALDYDPVTHAAKGLLCEPAGTNLLVYSPIGKPGFLWVVAAATGTGGQPDPSGGSEALQVAITVNNTGLNVSQHPVGLGIGTTYTGSAWCKGTNGEQIYFTANALIPAASVLVTFTGAWQRVSSTYTATAADAYVAFETYNRGGGAHLPIVTFQCWGGQLETGTVATSHIPTLAATVTRAADSYNCTPASINHSATVGSWWAETYPLEGIVDRSIIGYSISATPLYYNQGAPVILIDGGANLYKLGSSINTTVKSISAFQSGDRAVTYNGLAPATDAGTTTNLLSPATIYIGGGAGNAAMFGYIRKARYLPRRPSNAEMQSMTT